MTTVDVLTRYYAEPAAAFVRGRLVDAPDGSAEDLVRLGLASGLRLHKFKRSGTLPRVRSVLGMLRGLSPTDLLDIGTGRGVFLWPLLDQFPELSVTAVDRDPRRIDDLRSVAAGGFDRLRPVPGDVCRLEMPDKSVDGVTILEVLEHLADPARAVAEVVRVARRFVIASVPSRPDDNPEHIRLFNERSLGALFAAAGVRRFACSYVLNHLVAVAKL